METSIFLTLFLLSLTIAMFWLISFYRKVWTLPPGPFPMPLIGNLALFNQEAKLQHEILNELSLKYGSLFTLFFGSEATVFITDPEIVSQAIKDDAFAGRTTNLWSQYLMPRGSIDISFTDYTKSWETVKRVGHTAFRQFSNCATMQDIVIRSVDRILCENMDDPTDSNSLMTSFVTGILYEAAFGIDAEESRTDLKEWEVKSDYVQGNNIIRLMAFSPIFKIIYWSHWTRFKDNVRFMRDFIDTRCKNAMRSRSDEVHSIVGSLGAAIKMRQGKSIGSNEIMSQETLSNIIYDLMLAGPGAPITALRWIFLLLSKYPDFQERMRQEIKRVVGSADVRPNMGHMNSCHFVSAFIYETLRFRSPATITDQHKTTRDVRIGGSFISQGTTIIISLFESMHDENIWKDPEIFRPERFLNTDGKFVSKPVSSFIPFGGGKRTCPGDKLAITVLFLTTVRILQNADIIVQGSETMGLTGDVDVTDMWSPKPFDVSFRHLA